MNQHQFMLEVYSGPSSRHTCLECQQRRQFTRYIDVTTGEYLAEHVGMCNRRDNCGYHYTPKQYFSENGIEQPAIKHTRPLFPLKKPKRIIALPVELVQKTFVQSSYQRNNFIKLLHRTFDPNTVGELIERYHIGSSSRWNGATVFWLKDTIGQFVGGQVALFDPITGHTSRINGRRCTTWVHKTLASRYKDSQQPLPEWLNEYIENAEAYPIPFGAHLASNEIDKPIALVEAPKTAIIASPYFPQFVWMAIGSLSWLTAKRLQSLAGRQIVLFPDLSKNGKAYAEWYQKAIELSGLANIRVSNYLESVATEEERASGFDLADYLLTRCDWSAFQQVHQRPVQPVKSSLPKEHIVSTPYPFTFKRSSEKAPF